MTVITDAFHVTRQKIPMIHQSEAAECGLACLAMVAGSYGYKTDLNNLRQRFSMSAHGIDLNQLIGMAGRLNLLGRALKLDLEDLHLLQLPCILHWNMNHFVVLKKVTNKKFVIMDPAAGEKSFSSQELGQHFTGVALELTPSTEFKITDDKKTLKLSHFWTKIVGLKSSLLQILVLSLLLQVFTVASPFYMQTVVDDVVLRGDFSLLMILAIGFGFILLLSTVTTALRSFVILNLSVRLNVQMAANLFSHLIRLPMEYFETRHMGDVLSRFGSLQQVRELLTTGVVTALVDGIMVLITLVVMVVYSIKLALLVCVFVVMYIILRLAFYRPVRLLTEESIVCAAKEQTNFMETLRAIQGVKIYQKEIDRQNLWQNKYTDVLNVGVRIGRWEISFTGAEQLLFGLENIVVIYFAANAVMGNIISLGMLFAFMSYKQQFVSRMSGLVEQFINFRMLSLHLDRLADIAFSKTEASANAGFMSSPQVSDIFRGELKVSHLSYGYSESEPLVLKNINFEVNAGESVALVGPSGCGKTTLMKCMMGLLQTESGMIHVDGKPIDKVAQYRPSIAAVMQDDQLISGSIAENISFFSPKIDFTLVRECATMAAVDGDIEQLPMNYNTLVGDMGAALSGGQKQRILLARALYRRPKILFLDEATSHLDVSNEEQVSLNINKLQMTRIIIAHRPETVQSADRVINLLSGRD